mmetsp:Transcript_17137/g.33673  ORF Transcript_17137/g.33673 Transcript_17137/m.33673 type:complete len:93 (+) Transcript_17137:43-321(+)
MYFCVSVFPLPTLSSPYPHTFFVYLCVSVFSLPTLSSPVFTRSSCIFVCPGLWDFMEGMLGLPLTAGANKANEFPVSFSYLFGWTLLGVWLD